ncbi:MAG: hypothetical protein ACQR33_01210 [Candidatus Saccharibacteria bacterium]
MNKPQNEQESISDIKRKRTASRYAILVVLLLSLALVEGNSSGSNARTIIWAALSGLAILVLVWATFVSYKQSDERQQIVQLKAAALAFVAVLLGLFVAEMLHAIYAINLNIAIQAIFIGGILLWNSLAKALDRNRS